MMKIEITEMKSRELIKILTMYPYGSLETKQERIYWVSETIEPEITRQSPGDAPTRGYPPKGEDWGKRFRRMSDTMGSMIGPPQN